MKKRDAKKGSRFDTLTDEVIQQRWLALLPKALRGVLLFGVLSLATFMVNSFVALPEKVHGYMTSGVAFCVTLTGCTLFLAVMAFAFTRSAKRA